MKNKLVIYFSLILLLLTVLISSCTPDKKDEPLHFYNFNLKLDGITDYNFGKNIQADFGSFGTDETEFFDINIIDYNPQTFSMGFIVPMNQYFLIEKGKTCSIGSFIPIDSNGQPNDSITFTANIDLYIPSIEMYQWYDTGILGGGTIKFKDIEKDYIDIEFNFTAYHFYNPLEEPKKVSSKGEIRALPRKKNSG
ncbi:MAG: hypothetical protein ABJM36_00580 [Algibacter sp.]|uniref:hypothetical protein n=1 Tax=Algibacter sp. TaxID=1872428 RepID=UPI003297EE5C